MIYCKIEDGVVVNRAEGNPQDGGTWIASGDAQIGWSYSGGGFIAPERLPPPPITTDDVNAERQRRIGLPLSVTIAGSGTFAIDMSEQSRANISGLTTLAMILTGQGQSTTMTTFRDAENVDHNLTPAQAIQMGVQAAMHVDAIYKKSWALKALDPIPDDYSDDGYWE